MAKKISIKPLGDKVLVKPEGNTGEQKLSSGLIIPAGEKEKPMTGEVIAVGPGKYESGKLVPMQVKVGERVIFGKYSHDEVKIAGEEFYLISESNILAVIR